MKSAQILAKSSVFHALNETVKSLTKSSDGTAENIWKNRCELSDGMEIEWNWRGAGMDWEF